MTTHLRPVVDSICYCVHGHRMATYEISTEVYPWQLVKLCCKICNLPNCIANGNQQALCNISIRKWHGYNQQVQIVIKTKSVTHKYNNWKL